MQHTVGTKICVSQKSRAAGGVFLAEIDNSFVGRAGEQHPLGRVMTLLRGHSGVRIVELIDRVRRCCDSCDSLLFSMMLS